MGRLWCPTDNARWPLVSAVLVGRGASCLLRMEEASVSSEHALLTWDGEKWRVRDLDSKNGTFVNGVSLASGTVRALSERDTLRFGSSAEWVLDSDEPPTLLALAVGDRRAVEPEDGILGIPTPAAPSAAAWIDASGNTILEVDEEARAIHEPTLVYLESPWLVFPALPRDATPVVGAGLVFGDATLVFLVSDGEEDVELRVRQGGRDIGLGVREAYYVLMVLARARLEDANVPLDQRGWVSRDRLARMLRRSSAVVNVQVHRARRALEAAGVVGAGSVVETRRGARRFGTDRYVIEHRRG